MDLKLDGKIALVTGSSRGLGFAAALALAGESAQVAINSRNADEAASAAQRIHHATGARVLPLTADVTAAASADYLVAETIKYFGGLDILITNAGGPRPDPLNPSMMLPGSTQLNPRSSAMCA